uniref:(northern house mosquito) hypothetical protein n=1 Tax=Culex pipiens TaxID=7175 RepID=A0A8D8ATZ7_CULPI
MESPVPARSMPPPPPPKPHKSPILNGGGADKGHIYTNNNNNNGPILPQNGKSSLTAPFGASNPSVPPEDEQVVMTPRGKTANSTVLLIERKLVQQVGDRTHVAGGDHRGIIINKDTSTDPKQERPPAQLSLEFRVFLVSANTGQHSQESRKLRFWFREWIQEGDVQAHVAQDFFRELVSPKEFPRDYVGFIKKIMKQLQKGYNEIQAVEVELRILEQTSAPPSRPRKISNTNHVNRSCVSTTFPISSQSLYVIAK